MELCEMCFSEHLLSEQEVRFLWCLCKHGRGRFWLWCWWHVMPCHLANIYFRFYINTLYISLFVSTLLYCRCNRNPVLNFNFIKAVNTPQLSWKHDMCNFYKWSCCPNICHHSNGTIIYISLLVNKINSEVE